MARVLVGIAELVINAWLAFGVNVDGQDAIQLLFGLYGLLQLNILCGNLLKELLHSNLIIG